MEKKYETGKLTNTKIMKSTPQHEGNKVKLDVQVKNPSPKHEKKL